MDNSYLLELINETKTRGGGIILSYANQPAAVVLTIEKYNELLNKTAETQAVNRQPGELTQPFFQIGELKRPGKVLVTGGAGYIGGHLVRELILAGYQVTVLDNLSTGKKQNLDPKAAFIEGDLENINLLKDIFGANRFEAVFHMAASLEAEESVKEPEKYFKNNVENTINLFPFR